METRQSKMVCSIKNNEKKTQLIQLNQFKLVLMKMFTVHADQVR